MDLSIKVILIILFVFFATLSLFFIIDPNLISVFPGAGFTEETMYEWRLRTIIPSLYLTICYFIYIFRNCYWYFKNTGNFNYFK